MSSVCVLTLRLTISGHLSSYLKYPKRAKYSHSNSPQNFFHQIESVQNRISDQINKQPWTRDLLVNTDFGLKTKTNILVHSSLSI